MRTLAALGLVVAIGGLTATAARAADPPAADAADGASEPATEPEPRYNIMGPATCASWPKGSDITTQAKAVSLNWALGYLSGVATRGDIRLLGQIDARKVDVWLTTYCRAKPAASLPLALRDLSQDLEDKLPARPIVLSPMPPGGTAAVAAAKKADAAAPAADAPKGKGTGKRRKAVRRKAATRPAAVAPVAAAPKAAASAAPAVARPAAVRPAPPARP